MEKKPDGWLQITCATHTEQYWLVMRNGARCAVALNTDETERFQGNPNPFLRAEPTESDRPR